MKYQLVYSIEINFTLTDDEFKLLTDAIQSGEKAYEATRGQFWYGNMNRRLLTPDGAKEDCFYSATTRQMDVVILKSLEKYASFPGQGDHWMLGKALFCKLYNVLKDAIEISSTLNGDSPLNQVI